MPYNNHTPVLWHNCVRGAGTQVLTILIPKANSSLRLQIQQALRTWGLNDQSWKLAQKSSFLQMCTCKYKSANWYNNTTDEDMMPWKSYTAETLSERYRLELGKKLCQPTKNPVKENLSVALTLHSFSSAQHCHGQQSHYHGYQYTLKWTCMRNARFYFSRQSKH